MPLFYTLQVNNNSGTFSRLTFTANLNIPLMGNPAEYDVSVIRFKLPNYSTPLFTFVDGRYVMYLSYNGTTVSAPVIYIPQNSIVGTRVVFQMQGYIQMLNTTINTLYGLMNAIVTLPTAEQPYFAYNEVTKLITFTANTNDYGETLATPIALYCNEALFQQLGFPTYWSPTANFRIRVFDTKNNTVSTNYYVMSQQQPTLDLISDFTGIILTTNLPIKNEFSGIGEVNTGVSTGSIGNFNVATPILQDFVPQDLTMDTYSNSLVYNAITPYRQAELVSNSPFYSIVITAYSVNVAGTSTQLNLPPYGSANIKLMFTKKSENKFA